MDPRARVVAVVLALVIAVGAGWALGIASGDEGSPSTPASTTDQPSKSVPKPDAPSAAAADEYDLSVSAKRSDSEK